MISQEKQEQRKDSPKPSTSTAKFISRSSVWTEKALIRKLTKGREERSKFVESQVSQLIAAQVRSLRLRNKLSQPQLAEMIGTSQNQIFRLEKPISAKPKLSTLKRLAKAFDVALVVRFVPFTQFTAWFSGRPYLDNGLSTSALYVPSFENEMESSAIAEKPVDFSNPLVIEAQKDKQKPVANIEGWQKSMQGKKQKENSNETEELQGRPLAAAARG